MGKKATRKLLVVEIIGFIAVIAIIWMNELLDLPNLCLNAEPTPVNYTECLVESILVFVLGFVVVAWSAMHLRKLRYLEGFLPVCNYCRRINVDGKWISVSTYLNEYDEEEASHGRCPECAEQIKIIDNVGMEKHPKAAAQEKDNI